MKIKFLVHEKSNSFYALIDNETAYSISDGHSNIHFDYIKESRLATEKEIKESDILKSLKACQYNIIKRTWKDVYGNSGADYFHKEEVLR